MVSWLRRHQETLWWLHSFYALLLGIGIVWLGSQNFVYLRIAVFHVGFIWLSTLGFHKVVGAERLSDRWRGRIRAVINHCNKNLYQQVLFFILPIYYNSATFGARNFLFVVLVALSALLSSFDVIYDRQLSVRRGLSALFFAFNLFALTNVMIPVLWSIGNAWAMRMSAVLAFLGLLSLSLPLARLRAFKHITAIVAVALPLVVIDFSRGYVPPVPLRLVWSEFGYNFNPATKRVTEAVPALPQGFRGRFYGLTAIRAPLGLKEKIRHRWYVDGKLHFTSRDFEIVGGREDGFRLWTIVTLENIRGASAIHIDVETEHGQLVGRVQLRVRG